MSFKLPELFINDKFSWGPPPTELTVDGQPFQLHFKASALAAVDWNSAFRDTLEESKMTSAEDGAAAKHRGNFTVIEDDTRMRALKRDYAKKNKPSAKRVQRRGKRNYERPRKIVDVQSTWPVRVNTRIFAEFNQSELSKCSIVRPPQVHDMVLAGLPRVYDTAMDKVSHKTPKLLDESNYRPQFFQRQDIAADPVVRKLLSSFQSKVVVVSDEVLALIMTSNLTLHPWHISAMRFGDYLFLDKDVDSERAGNVDRQWVSETASREVAPTEDTMDPRMKISALGDESTKVHDCFIRSSCRSQLANMTTERNPFSNIQPRLYCYRNFKLNADTPEEYNLIVRCEVDAVTGADNSYVRLFGFLEQPQADPSGDLSNDKSKFDVSKLSKSFDMNRGKIGRWIALSNLCSAKLMKIGFISRVNNPLSPTECAHEVLSVQTDAPQSLAAQLGINIFTLWAIVDTIVSSIYASIKSSETAIIVKPRGEGRIVICEAENEDSSLDDDDDDDDEEDD